MVYFFLTFIENILSSMKICLEGKGKKPCSKRESNPRPPPCKGGVITN